MKGNPKTNKESCNLCSPCKWNFCECECHSQKGEKECEKNGNHPPCSNTGCHCSGIDNRDQCCNSTTVYITPDSKGSWEESFEAFGLFDSYGNVPPAWPSLAKKIKSFIKQIRQEGYEEGYIHAGENYNEQFEVISQAIKKTANEQIFKEITRTKRETLDTLMRKVEDEKKTIFVPHAHAFYERGYGDGLDAAIRLIKEQQK